MLRIEIKVCKKCGKLYIRSRGGIVSNPLDYCLNYEMCAGCRKREIIEKTKKRT